MAAPSNQTALRRAFVDICRGYSVTSYDGTPIYIRHLSHVEHVSYDEVQAGYEADARRRGGKTEAEKMAELKAEGSWSDAKDKAIARQKDSIIRFEETIKNTAVPSVANGLANQVAEERKKLEGMLTERATLLGMTVEAYAQRRLNDYYVGTNLFRDAALTQPLFPGDAFDNLPDPTSDAILAAYHAAIDACGDESLRQLAVQDFFTACWAACSDNASVFYGRPVWQLTYYQIRLASLGRYFKALLDGIDLNKLPPETRGDPDAIERAFTTKRALEAQQAEGKLPGQMTQSDIQQTGLQGQYAQVSTNESAIDMVKRLRANHRPG